MSVETNTYGFEPVKPFINSGMEFIRPELTVVPAIEQAEAEISPEQRNSLSSWVEANQEDATMIGDALNSDPVFAGLFSIIASNDQLRTSLLEKWEQDIERELIAGDEVELEQIPEITPSRWSKVREKIVEVYVQLDAGLNEDFEADNPLGQSWSKKTPEAVEWEVANDPRKSILFANRPELRRVVTEPSRLEDFMNTNKAAASTLDFIGKTVDKPLAKFGEQSKKLEEFLDDSRTLQEITLDSGAIVANSLIDGIIKLAEYDEKLIAATCRMIDAMNIPEKYTKVRAYEDALTEKIADRIIEAVTEYDYKAAYSTVSSALKPESKRTKAAMAAGAAMSWVALSVTGIEVNTPAESKEKRIETVVSSADTATGSKEEVPAPYAKKPAPIIVSPYQVNPTSK